MIKKKIAAAGIIVLALTGIGSGAALAATPTVPPPRPRKPPASNQLQKLPEPSPPRKLLEPSPPPLAMATTAVTRMPRGSTSTTRVEPPRSNTLLILRQARGESQLDLSGRPSSPPKKQKSADFISLATATGSSSIGEAGDSQEFVL